MVKLRSNQTGGYHIAEYIDGLPGCDSRHAFNCVSQTGQTGVNFLGTKLRIWTNDLTDTVSSFLMFFSVVSAMFVRGSVALYRTQCCCLLARYRRNVFFNHCMANGDIASCRLRDLCTSVAGRHVL